jgi:hypothetical protein
LNKKFEDLIMNKLIISVMLSLMIPGLAFATASEYTTTSYTADPGGTMYVTTDFDLTKSSGVEVWTNEDESAFAVGADHPKGSTEGLGYGGTTNGGVVAKCQTDFKNPNPAAVPEVTDAGGTVTSAAVTEGC